MTKPEEEPALTPEELRTRTTLTANEAARVFGIATGASAYRAANAGIFPGAFKAHGKWIIPARPLLRMLLIEEEDELGLLASTRGGK